MASGQTREVRLEPGTIRFIISFRQKTEDMQQIRPEILTVFNKNHTDLSLHCPAAIDIIPIVKTIVTGEYQRHCSTTFYQ